MPGWHEKTKALLDAGELRMVGIIEEQHPDRTRLFMQWKQMEWPLLLDSLNLLGVSAVPLTYLVDERGIVRYERPSDEDLKTFLETDYAAATAVASESLVVAPGTAEHRLLWGGTAELDRAIALLEERVARRPEDASAQFRLGVAYRRRYDSSAARDSDFRSAVEHWGRALELDPNQYIFRRRIQQYGPRLDKPYPFYDWVREARDAVSARGETPVALDVEPGGAELAAPLDGFETSRDGAEDPDPEGRILRDEAPLIRLETVTVPSAIAPGETARVHVVFRPDPAREAHWNNEVDDLVFWLSPPEGFRVDRRYHRVEVPPEPVSQETRRVELEVETPADFRGQARLSGYALYYVCEDVDGTCLYRRRDVEVTLRAK